MKRILIVEDDILLNKTLAYNLASEGYDIASAANSKTASEMLKTGEYDLVLLDINLSDGNGYDLCRLIKLEHPDTVVILLTVNDQESDQLRGYESIRCSGLHHKAFFRHGFAAENQGYVLHAGTSPAIC